MITAHIYNDSWNKLDTIEVKSVSDLKPYFRIGVFNKSEQILVIRMPDRDYEKLLRRGVSAENSYFDKRCVKLSYWNYFVARYWGTSENRSLVYHAALHTTVTEQSCRIYM